MKKLSFLFVILIILSCSSSDEVTNNSNQSFNPPSWIQGTWSFDEVEIVGFVFGNNSFCPIFYTQLNCFPNELSVGYDVDEQIDGTNYIVKIIIGSVAQGQQINTYEFSKIDDKRIYFNDPILGNRILYKLQNNVIN